MTGEEAQRGFEKFVADCNKDPGYGPDYAAGVTFTELQQAYKAAYPRTDTPIVLESPRTGRYELYWTEAEMKRDFA
ncbi:hypothetical protein LJR129_005237 [Acidovorax sp. LjRoot129]|uniref:hypothetical protein n=1 Tax=Acidovorax sp. LjRoot129 TaxID=3342260 RepID=UPI003ECECA54